MSFLLFWELTCKKAIMLKNNVCGPQNPNIFFFLKNNIKQWIVEVQIVVYKGRFYLHGEDLRGQLSKDIT